jgi:hypothetical protein
MLACNSEAATFIDLVGLSEMMISALGLPSFTMSGLAEAVSEKLSKLNPEKTEKAIAQISNFTFDFIEALSLSLKYINFKVAGKVGTPLRVYHFLNPGDRLKPAPT